MKIKHTGLYLTKWPKEFKLEKYFSVSNWNEFQHYKDRNPPWIKLHNQLLDNYEFENLTDSTKGHLLCIWMLASRTNNKLPYDQLWIKRKIGANSTIDLKSLENSGFIEVQGVEQSASKVLVSEEERRGETEKRREDYSGLLMNDFEVSEVVRIRRSNKGGKITQRVIDSLSAEFKSSRRSGMTNDQILTEWETRGWKSFKAEWVKSNYSNQNNQEQFSDNDLSWRQTRSESGVII